MSPVSGQFVYDDGSPAVELKGCTVSFEIQTADGKSFSAAGEIDDQGRFRMTTEKENDGAVVGTHKVAIAPHWPGSSDRPKPLPVDSKYENFETSGLTAVVGSGKNDIKLTVQRKAKR